MCTVRKADESVNNYILLNNKDFSELRKDFYGGMRMKNQNKLVTSLNCLK